MQTSKTVFLKLYRFELIFFKKNEQEELGSIKFVEQKKGKNK